MISDDQLRLLEEHLGTLERLAREAERCSNARHGLGDRLFDATSAIARMTYILDRYFYGWGAEESAPATEAPSQPKAAIVPNQEVQEPL